MKIYITNISNTYNYGSMMMAEVLMNYIDANISNVSFYIDAKTIDHVDRLKYATGLNNIYLDKIYNVSFTTSINPIKRLLVKICRDTKFFVSFNLKRCLYDAIIILGGDDYSEIYFKIPNQSNAVLNHLKRLEKYNKASKLFMIGQTIGPYTGVRLEFAKKVFKNIKIYARDEMSKEYMRDKMNKEVSVMRDLAFEDLHLEKGYLQKKDSILAEYDIKENEYITVVGSGLYNCYTEDEKLFNETFIKVLETIQEEYPNKKVVFLAHVTNKSTWYSDISFISKIRDKIPEGVILIDEIMLPAKARIILGSGYLTITYRMHAAVSTFHMGKPALCISYSPKYMGVIGKGLGQEKLIIESTKATFKKENIIIDLKEKIKIVNSNYLLIQKTVKLKVEEAKEITNNALKNIVEILKEG